MECASRWSRGSQTKRRTRSGNNRWSRIDSFSEEQITTKKKRASDGSQLPAGGNRTEFGTRLHDAENGVAGDHSNDLGRIVAGAAHHGHLIDIRAQEPLEQTQERLVRRCP